MEYVKLLYSLNSYSYNGGSCIKIDILGCFLSTDVGCGIQTSPTYQDWIQDDSLGYAVSGNITCLEKEGDIIILEDMLSEEKIPTKVKLSRKQLVQLLDDWQEKVCKTKPQYIMIKYENDQYTIETSETPFD